MTQMIYFITPKSLIKITTKAGEFLPIVGPTLTYTKKAQKMTSTQQLQAVFQELDYLDDGYQVRTEIIFVVKFRCEKKRKNFS